MEPINNFSLLGGGSEVLKEFHNNINVVRIKDEEDEVMEIPKPYDGLHDNGQSPPFLSKTYDMVDDPNTDPIISWAETSDSFIVKDHHVFSTVLLPKHFKHSNFSSFIRQLNTYGFKKVQLDRWEFANPGFQKGKKHLLKSIKRRNNGTNNNVRSLHQKETEIENLKKEQEALKVEILDLKQQKQNSDTCLAAMGERIKTVEWKQRDFVMLLHKVMKRTAKFEKLLQKHRQKKALSSGEELQKKRRFSAGDSFVDSFVAKGCTPNDDQCHKEDVCAAQLEENSLLGSAVDLGPSLMPDQKSSLKSETASPDLYAGSYMMLEKLMEDGVICSEDNKEETLLGVDQTNYVHELEDLIKPIGLIGFTNVGEIACPMGQ